MPSIVLVNKNGDLKQSDIKEFTLESICKNPDQRT